jgi:NodT family efflux transporter outer membrane factor (OMF) lipoprotein
MLAYRQMMWLWIPLFLSACAVGPDYVRPSAVVPASFKEAKGKKVMGSKRSKDWKIAQPCDAKDRGAWWTVFNDRELNRLETQLNISNQTILNAEANYRQARALVDEARASFFPTLTGSITVTRQKQGTGATFFSSTSGVTTSTGSASTGTGGVSKTPINTTHSLLLNGSWEPDIWGLVRRTVEASAAGAQASAALLASTRLSSQASLAQYYFELRGLDTDQKLLDDTVKNYKKALRLTRNQYVSGVASRADVVQAQSQLEAAQATAINNGILRAQYEHAIAVLIGVPPSNVVLPPHVRKTTPPPIPLELPSALLERRPDVAQAERLMAQANAQIGVAVAAYYPALTLSGSASATGKGLAHFFSIPTLGWAYGPQLSDVIYDGGLRSATVRAASAGFDATVASYRQTVLAAFQDVEDNLASLRILAAEAVVQDQAVASAKLALKLVINQYKAGTVPYSSVITAQTTAFTAEKNAADINYLRMTSAVGLIKALGGGWDASKICNAADNKV